MNEPDVELTIGTEESHYVYVRNRYLCRWGALKDVNGKSPLQFGKDARPAYIPLAFWGGVGIAVLTPRIRYFGSLQVYLCLTMTLGSSFVFFLSMLQDWDTSVLLVVLGTLLLAATVGALLLWELGSKHFDLEVKQLVKNSLQTRALECGWDLIYDCSCTETNHTFLEFKKLPISVAPSYEEIPSSMHSLKWPTHILRFRVHFPPSGLMRRPPLLHDGIIACTTRTGIDPWTVGAVLSTLNDATLLHDNAELGHHPHCEWLCTNAIYLSNWVMLLSLILGRYAADHDFNILSLVVSLSLCIFSLLFVGLLIWDWRLTRSRLERSIAVQQQALQEEFGGAVVMSLDDRSVLLEFRRVDANPTPITAMPIV